MIHLAMSLVTMTSPDFPQDFEIMGWYPAGPVLPYGEKVSF